MCSSSLAGPWPDWRSLFLLLCVLCAMSASSTSKEAADKTEKKNLVGQGRLSNGGKILPAIYWNTSNPIFRIDNTDHIMDVNQGERYSPFVYDQVNIICPLYGRPTGPGDNAASAASSPAGPNSTSPPAWHEQYIIYAVNKEEYETCRIMTQHPRVLAKCDSPYEYRYFTISFRSFSPTPGALEFKSGRDYYFISTSDVDDLHRRVEGMCHKNNMKIVFKVNSKDAVKGKRKRKKLADGAAAGAGNGVEGTQQKQGRHKSRVRPQGKERRRRKKKKSGSAAGEEPELKSFDYFLTQTKEGAVLNDLPRGGGGGHATASDAERPGSGLGEDGLLAKKKKSGLVKQEASTAGGASTKTHCGHLWLLLAPAIALWRAWQ